MYIIYIYLGVEVFATTSCLLKFVMKAVDDWSLTNTRDRQEVCSHLMAVMLLVLN